MSHINTVCPVCQDEFSLTEDGGDARPPFPSDWALWVAHDHSASPPATPVWKAVLFHHSAREKYPVEAKAIAALQKQGRKDAKQTRAIENASKGKRERGIA